MKTVTAQKTGKLKVISVNAVSPETDKKIKKTQTTTRKAKTTGKPKHITHEMIALRAWSTWMSKGCVSGQDETNWYQAELELRTERINE